MLNPIVPRAFAKGAYRAGTIILAAVTLSCSAAERTPGGGSVAGSAGIGTGFGGTAGHSAGVPSGGTAGGGSLILPSGGTQGSGAGGACAIDRASAELTRAPIDILMVLDNSGSMHQEMGAVERNINQNFGSILTASGVDYRVVLLSRHRNEARTTGETAANTSVCVTSPLSGLAECPAPEPVYNERFIQYGQKIESFDALNWILDAYRIPPKDDDIAHLIPTGYGAFLRDGAKKVILVLTDDNEGNVGDLTPLTIPQFLQGLAGLSSAHFGTAAAPTFTFHSIIGLKEKADVTAAYLPNEPVQLAKCAGHGAVIPHVGTLYQELSIQTGGLRFPICEFPGYDAVFRRIAEDVTIKSSIRCDFSIPMPTTGTLLVRDNVAVNHVRASGAGNLKLGQVPAAAQCRPDAFYIENDRVWLCPTACDAVKADLGAEIEVLFTCESQLLVPR